MIRYHLARSVPTEEPLTVQDVRRYLRISHNSEDEDLARWISAAREAVEAHTSVAAGQRAVTITRDSFPSYRSPLLLPVRPINQLTSIDYLDAEERMQSLDVSTVKLQNTFLPSLVPENEWPATTNYRDDAVTIVCDSGWDRASCPPGIKMAMLSWIGQAYENRGDTELEPPRAFYDYLAPYNPGDEFIVYA